MQTGDALIGDIYECVVDPRGWPAVIARVIEAIGGTAGWVAVHRPDRVRSTYQIEIGTDPEWQRRLREDYVAISPFIGVARFVGSGDLLSVDDVVDYDEFVAGRFFREWAAPQGWPDLLFAVLSREVDRFSFLGVCLPDRATAEHKRVAARFAPHLDRALRILDLLDRKERQLSDLESAVAVMATGVALVDGNAGLVGINPSAEDLLGRLVATTPGGSRRLRLSRETETLRQALAGCAARTVGQDGVTLLLEAEEDRRVTVHVVPLPEPKMALGDGAVAALFVSDPDRPASLPPDAVIQRFGLTPSELRVALALVEGKSPAAIAALQGVSLATVRTHLRRLYEKTETAGQAALVRKVGTAIHGV